MSILHNSIKRSVVKVYHEEDTDLLGNICRTSLDCDTGGGEVIAGPNMEAEKRIRREIANSNERRRMQSINAGFQSLRTLLPHHEGEKLSKAAILQQTAEYIYNLEQEKTRLLSQNCQLMRQVQQHEGDVPPKKRIKTEMMMASSIGIATVAAESSDEGLGSSISPEPILLKSGAELTELRRQLERERTLRLHLEEQIRTMELQLYQHQQQQQQHQQQQHQYENNENLVRVIDENEDDIVEMQLIQAENIPLIGQTETVVCCSPQMSRSSSPSRPSSPEVEASTVVEVVTGVKGTTGATGTGTTTTEYPPRLPSVLEAAIKAEPKVEVERLPSPSGNNGHEDVTCSRLYVANTSRQNLETIVEAIRHLEGDHLFSDEPPTSAPSVPQEAPLALITTCNNNNTNTNTNTNKPPLIKSTTSGSATKTKTITISPPHTVKVEMNHYLQFHTPHQHQHQHQHQQQSRPGVIVVKQHS